MEILFKSADEYLKRSDWKDLAMIKFCLCAIGIIIGLSIPKKKRKVPLILAVGLFIGTYIPLMKRYGEVLIDLLSDEVDEELFEE